MVCLQKGIFEYFRRGFPGQLLKTSETPQRWWAAAVVGRSGGGIQTNILIAFRCRPREAQFGRSDHGLGLSFSQVQLSSVALITG